ncbi:hypothetical protein [Plantibacter sp. M259]|uniref:galactose-binding domain-containing protein n=1 Tax=Plantibacter sp. M259 TaxID=2583822 RepID=UPI001110E2E4|nr:hypothetical protein [Plantibacter sp. M259]
MSRISPPKVLAAALAAAVIALGSLTPATAATPRTDLALGADVTVSSTHPHNNFALAGSNLVDGSSSTRWAAADDATFPLTIDLGFTSEVTFTEVVIDEFVDSGTNARVAGFELQRWVSASSAWETFSASSGLGRKKSISGFGEITSSKVRLSIAGLLPGETYTPTLTGIALYATAPEAPGTGGEGTPAASDAPYIAFETAPAGKTAIDPGARVTQIDTPSTNGSNSIRVVESDGDVFLQQVAEDSGAATQTLEISSNIDEVTSGTASLDYGAASPYPLNITLFGTKDGQPIVLRVITPGSSSLGTAASTTFETLDAAAFEQRTGVAITSLELISPFSTGYLAVYSTPSGYGAKRLTYALAPQAGRDPITLPFSQVDREFRLDTYGDLYSSRVGAVEKVSMYDLSAVATVELPGVGIAASWLLKPYAVLLVADAAGKVANVSLKDGVALRGVITLPTQAASLAFVEYTSEIQLATAGATQIRRFAASDSSERTPLDAAGVVLPGSLSSFVSWNPATTYLAAIEKNVYSYRASYVSSAKPWFTPSLSAAKRGAGIDFAYSGAGTGLSSGNAWFEYSLDGGASWAKRGDAWSDAVADRGNVTTPPGALAEPQDGIAPYLRQNTEDVWASTTLGVFYGDIVLPAEQYDALWRYRLENVYGSVASAATKIRIESEQEVDPTLRVTTQPTAARVSVGESLTLTAAAAAALPLTVQWQRSADGTDWADIDGATGDSLTLTASAADTGSSFRAVYTAGDSTIQSEPASIAVMVPNGPVTSAAPAGAVIAADARFTLDLSTYSQEWVRDVASKNVSLGTTGFEFSTGSGWTDPASGETQLSWSGTAIYRPYGGYLGLYMAYANPHLAIAANGQATLTAEIAWNDGGGKWSGPVENSYKRVIVATFADSELTTATDGTLSFAGTPEWSGRAYSQGAGEVYADSFPASLVDYFDPSNRPWFYATGSFRDPEKAGLPVTATATVTTETAPTAGSRVDPLDPLGDGKNPFTPSSPTVVAQPQSATIGGDGTANLTATATGSPAPTIRWQQLLGAVWTDIDGATTTTYTATGLAEGAHSFRAVFTGGGTSVESETAVVTVSADAIDPQPSAGPALSVTPGSQLEDDAKLTVSGSGYEQHTNRHGAYLLFGYATTFPSAGGKLGVDYDYAAGMDNQRFIAWPGSATAGASQALFTDSGFTVDDFAATSTFIGASGAAVDCRATGITCGVFTIGAHGSTDAALETFTPVTFTTVAPEPGTNPGTEPGTNPGTEPGTNPGTEPGTEPAPLKIEPSGSDLTLENEGRITVPVSAIAGSTIAVSVGSDRAADRVAAYLFSEPSSLGTHKVSESGTFEVRLPADVTGVHRLAVYDEDGIIGWASISIAALAGNGDKAKDTMAVTGTEFPSAAILSAFVLILLGGVLIKRRRKVTA